MDDRNLAFIALQAALEIDNILLGKAQSADVSAVQRLSELLTQNAGDSIATTGMDPVTANLLSRAFHESNPKPEQTIAGILKKARSVAGQLSKLPDSSDQLQELRSICVALSQSSLSSRRSVAYLSG